MAFGAGAGGSEKENSAAKSERRGFSASADARVSIDTRFVPPPSPPPRAPTLPRLVRALRVRVTLAFRCLVCTSRRVGSRLVLPRSHILRAHMHFPRFAKSTRFRFLSQSGFCPNNYCHRNCVQFFSSYISLSISTFVSGTNATRLSAIMIRRPPTSDVRSRFSYAACELRTRWHRNRSGHWLLATGYWPLATGQSPSPKPKAKAIRYDATADATLSTRSSFRCYVRPPVAVVRTASASASTRRVAPFGVGPRGSARLLHSLSRFFCDAKRALRSRVAARPAESMRSRSLPRARAAQVVAAWRRCRVSSDATRRLAEVSCSGRRFRTFVVRISHFVRAHIIRRLRPVTFSTAGIWPSLTTRYTPVVVRLYLVFVACPPPTRLSDT